MGLRPTKEICHNLLLRIFLISLLFVHQEAYGIKICYEDYPETHYDLFCQNKDDTLIVIKTSASFVTTNVLNKTCLIQPSLILNSSEIVISNLCNYCFDKNPCSITSQIIDDSGMFDGDTYQVSENYSPIPLSVGIFYICIDPTQVEVFSQASLCTDPSFLYKTTTLESISSTIQIQSSSTFTTTSNSSPTSPFTSTTKHERPNSPDNNIHLEVSVICLKSDFFSIHQKKDVIYFALIISLIINILIVKRFI